MNKNITETVHQCRHRRKLPIDFGHGGNGNDGLSKDGWGGGDWNNDPLKILYAIFCGLTIAAVVLGAYLIWQDARDR